MFIRKDPPARTAYTEDSTFGGGPVLNDGFHVNVALDKLNMVEPEPWIDPIEAFDFSDKARAARAAARPVVKGHVFKTKADKVFEIKVAEAVANRDWQLVRTLHIQYGAYLELVS